MTWEALKRPMRPKYKAATAPLRRLPNTLIVGAQKGGTTSLYNYLCQHPRVQPATTKEIHYFDNHYEKGRLWYRSHFPYAWTDADVVVEGTTGYMFFDRALPRLAAMLPDAKLIAVLRDPVERTHSHYRHTRRGMGRHQATEQRSFEDAVRDDIRRARDGLVLGRVDSDHYLADRYYAYVRRGIYRPQVERLLDRYGDDVLILRSCDLFDETQSTMQSVFGFLGLKSHTTDTGRVYNEGGYSHEIPMEDELRDFFRPYNRKLYSLLDVEPWWE